MSDDDLQITHMVVPRKWMVAVLGVMISALGSGAGAIYKYGSVAGRLAELERRCPTPAALIDARPAAAKAP